LALHTGTIETVEVGNHPSTWHLLVNKMSAVMVDPYEAITATTVLTTSFVMTLLNVDVSNVAFRITDTCLMEASPLSS
jgi:hypothetical protein